MVEEGTRPQSKRDERKCFLFIQLVLFKVISNWCDNWMNSKKISFFFFFYNEQQTCHTKHEKKFNKTFCKVEQSISWKTQLKSKYS